MSYKVLIVDDELPNARLLERALRQTYFCLIAPSGEEALKLLALHDVAVIITDQQLTGMTGMELLKRSADCEPDTVRILLGEDADQDVLVETINSGLVDLYLRKPWNTEDLNPRIGQAVQRYFNNKRRHSLLVANECLLTRLREMKLGSVRAMANVLKMEDEYLFTRGSRVSKWASIMGESFGLSEALRSDLAAAGLLHDLGTIGISHSSLAHSGPYSGRELATMYPPHPERAAKILSCIPELRDTADIIRYQNENYDGSGCPLGLVGEEIPLTSRIIRLANEYDLLTNPRDPAEAISHHSAIEKLEDGVYREFDPQVVQAFSALALDDLNAVQELNVTGSKLEIVSVAIN
jgi:putative two-component system response regulator